MRPNGAPSARDPCHGGRAARGGSLLALGMALAVAAPGRAAPAAPSDEEVRIHLALGSRPHGSQAEREAMRELEYEIAGRLAAASAGEVVRDEWPAGWCVIRIAAPDAAAAWAIAGEAVRAYGPRPGSYAVVRRGGPGAPEEKVPL